MPVSRDLSVTYGGLTFGGSTARQIDGYTIHEEEFERGFFEFAFVTTAASDAAFATEIIAVRDVFRTPRGDLVVTQGASTLLSRKHSLNTGLDTEPIITKDGDPADTGRSRYFKVRISYGLPADVTSTSFRRTADINVDYSPSRQRTVTITGTYTANSTDGITASFAQYRASISAYAATVMALIDSAATFEVIGEPVVTFSDTNKVCDFAIVYKEILSNQASGVLNDAAIVDPEMSIVRNRLAPGDSTAGMTAPPGRAAGPAPGSFAGGFPGGPGSTVVGSPPGSPGTTTVQERPYIIRVTYTCAIDQNVTKDLQGKWTSTIRPFLISQAQAVAGRGVTLVDEKPDLGQSYPNRISVTMEFFAYLPGVIIEQRVKVEDASDYGKKFAGVWSGDPTEFYKWQAFWERLRTITEFTKKVVNSADPNPIVDGLVYPLSGGAAGGEVIRRSPAAVVLVQGLDGGVIVNIAEITIETIIKVGKFRGANVANAGGLQQGGAAGGGGSNDVATQHSGTH
jgi:hypothetical protein